MKYDDLQALAKEYNVMAEKGSVMWAELETMTARMKDIRNMIDDERPGCYDEISLLFGGELIIDVLLDSK